MGDGRAAHLTRDNPDASSRRIPEGTNAKEEAEVTRFTADWVRLRSRRGEVAKFGPDDATAIDWLQAELRKALSSGVGYSEEDFHRALEFRADNDWPDPRRLSDDLARERAERLGRQADEAQAQRRASQRRLDDARAATDAALREVGTLPPIPKVPPWMQTDRVAEPA